jgi:hypothetical protein
VTGKFRKDDKVISRRIISHQLSKLETTVAILKPKSRFPIRENDFLIRENDFLIKENDFLIRENDFLIRENDF